MSLPYKYNSLVIEDIPAKEGWKRVGIKHHHGIYLPLISLITSESCGNGEFLDLIPLIDWLASLGMDVLQLLPLNDSGKDPSPYNALSATALHPIYLSLHALPNQAEDLSPLKKFNGYNRVPYKEVLKNKLQFLKRYVAKEGIKISRSDAYQTFIKESPHLIDYALYKTVKEKHQDKEWFYWTNGQKKLSKSKRKSLENLYEKEMSFHLIVQYLCHCQLRQVKKHANEKGVFLKGDIPILLSPDSADVWTHQELFDLSETAGSPPNRFDITGQNWLFPLYNWKAIEENHFEWWRKRIEIAARYFDIYRIDHILGFFRIWAIPINGTPDQGHFVPDDPELMHVQGRKLLKALISFSSMLPIGEDLGDPPPFVYKTMQELGIPGIKIFRRYRHWKTDGSFIPYEDYTPLSISSISTHDTETIRLWWEAFPEEAKAYAAFKNWDYHPTLSIEKHKEILRDNHHCGSLFHVNLLQEYLALTPELTWENPKDELINIPGTKSPFNWTYRYKSSVETITSHAPLREMIASILSSK